MNTQLRAKEAPPEEPRVAVAQYRPPTHSDDDAVLDVLDYAVIAFLLTMTILAGVVIVDWMANVGTALLQGALLLGGGW